MMRVFILQLMITCLVLAHKPNNIRLPILEMPFIDWQSLSSSWVIFGERIALVNKGAPMHLLQIVPQKYTIDTLYDSKLGDVQNEYYTKCIIGLSPPDPSTLKDFNYYWSVLIPPSDINDSLKGVAPQSLKLGQIQEMQLMNISRKMKIDLSKVAGRLSVPERNLSYSYDPEKWSDIVHAMVEEGVERYVQLLDVANEDILASLFGLSKIQLTNSTIDAFLTNLPPLLAKKYLMDTNKTGEILEFAGFEAESNNAVIYKLINISTSLTLDQFGVLFNLTAEQRRAVARSTLSQMSSSCGIEMKEILSKTVPKMVWDTLGESNYRSVSCLPMLSVKGATIKSLSKLSDESSKTVLQLFLYACNNYWKSCRLTMDLGPREWECSASKTLSEAASIVGIEEATLLDSPVNDVVAAINSKCKSGAVSFTSFRSKLQVTLKSMFNLTLSEVETLLKIPNAQGFTSPQLVRAFLNATSKDLEIELNAMYNTTTRTLEEFLDSPIDEVAAFIPFILRAAVMKPASDLHMTIDDTLFIFKLFAHNSTIGEYKHAAKHVLPFIVKSKTKFENDTLGSLLIAQSISDADVLNVSVLNVLLKYTGFNLDTMTTIFGLSNAQISVLRLLSMKNLETYCNLSLAELKTKTCFNITRYLVGIDKVSATCKATRFYVAAKHIKVQELESLCPLVAQTTNSLLSIVEGCSGLKWRFSAEILGVQLQDWVQMAILNREKLATHSQLDKDTILTKTFINLLAEANQIHKTKASFKTELAAYSQRMSQKLYLTFSTDESEASRLTSVAFSKLTLLDKVAKIQDFLKIKYTISLSKIASELHSSLDDLEYLAETEWSEMIPSLTTEIINSGSEKLHISIESFRNLLKIPEVESQAFTDFVKRWDVDYIRLLNGKTNSENKTLSEIQTDKNIKLTTILENSLVDFYNRNVKLSLSEISTLYGMSVTDLDVLTQFTLKELPCSCKFSSSHMMVKTPNVLLSSLVGKGDLVSCRPIAVLNGFHSLSIDSLSTKFNLTFNTTESILAVAQWLSDLPYEKISWALGMELSDWTILSAVSLQSLSTTTAKTLSELKNIPLRNVTNLISLNKAKFSSDLQTFHSSLLDKAAKTFSFPSSTVCGQCSIPSGDVLKTFLDHLGGVLYLDPKNIPPVDGFDCITHDVFLLQQSKWNLLIPGSIPPSFQNISAILGITESDLENILAASRPEIFNMTLPEYLQLISTRIRPMVNCFHSIHADNAWQKISEKGIEVTLMKRKSVLDTISLMCSDTSAYNMSAIMGWKGLNLSILHNTTMEDAALCQRVSIKTILSRNIMDLAALMLNDIYGCNVIPCRSGTLRDEVHYNCSDVNECSQRSICETEQYCQNYFGGHECECTEAGHCLAGKVCDKCLRFSLILVIEKTYTNDLGSALTLGFYIWKEKLEREVDKIFSDIPEYRKCSVIRLTPGSVRSEMSLYTSTQYEGSATDLQKHFRNKLNVTENDVGYLDDMKILANSLTDYNECSKNQINCHQHATCVNKEGTFSCKCKSGYDGNGVHCEAGFLKTYWWLVIVLAVVLLIIIIMIIVLIIKKPKLKSFKVDEEIQKPVMKRANSNLSYRSGDVYFKDKQGNMRTGSRFAEPMETTNPIYGKEIPENLYDNNGSRSPSNIYAMDNLGADQSPRDEESIELEMTSTFDGAPKENGVQVEDKIL